MSSKCKFIPVLTKVSSLLDISPQYIGAVYVNIDRTNTYSLHKRNLFIEAVNPSIGNCAEYDLCNSLGKPKKFKTVTCELPTELLGKPAITKLTGEPVIIHGLHICPGGTIHLLVITNLDQPKRKMDSACINLFTSAYINESTITIAKEIVA